MMVAIDWTEYDRWNAVLASRLFGALQADLPAYIDVDEALLEDCAKDLGLVPQNARESLVGAVQGTLGLGPGQSVLKGHVERYGRWRKQFLRDAGTRNKRSVHELPVPPVVALLCVFVMAAEKMGSDAAMAAHAYYPRLGELLGLSPANMKRLRAKFPATEPFWRGLNEYLVANEGRYGLPTAFSLGHRYVGIPQSQALVRASDRVRLPDFFRTFGLAPGSELIAADLERLLDGWISSTPSPVTANLRRLWEGVKARERVAGVVAVELAHWDGRGREASAPGQTASGGVELTALLRQQFGGLSLELSFAARLPVTAEVTSLRINSAESQPSIGVIPAAGARLRPTPGSRLDPDSLVGARLELEDPQSSQVVVRRPRRVVPLRRDELLGILVEVDRVQLADDAVLLVKDEDTLLDAVLALVESYGHHGRVHRSSSVQDQPALKGLPTGWALIDDVQIYAIPQDVKKLDLHVLVPLTTAQLNLSGGLKLPGRIRKWSSLHPPEIRAAVSEAQEMSISLTEVDVDRVLVEKWTERVAAMVIPLDGLELGDGDYEIELSVNGAQIAMSTLRLRSADTPDAVSWETCTRLNYELDRSSLGCLSAVEASEDSEIIVDGLNTLGARPDPVPSVPVRHGANWSTERKSSGVEQPVIVLGVADPKSCVATGAHYIELPTWHGGRSSGQILGICRMCGLKKSMPARPKWKSLGASASTPTSIQFSELPSHTDLGATWDVCLDALVHVGGGTIGSLERIATQSEGSSLFVDSFLRTLETLGQIDVRRDSSLQPREWEANPAYLAETVGNGFVLAGAWSNAERRSLREGLAEQGADLVCQTSEGRLSSWFVRGMEADRLAELVTELALEAYVVPDAVSRMVAALPPLSQVEASLSTVPIPDYSKATIFDVREARWRKVPGVGMPGAYRLEQSFRTTTLWVDHQGATERSGRVGSVQLVKHLAARASRTPLIGYLKTQSTLVVPLGADLPGLYGRVAALCSGLAPRVSVKTRSIGYPDVPRPVADALNSLLAS
ncbi:hypothetical protein ISU10_02390 [Nocardioides agariphilus]|uniref:Uncharacterized protein n=1 Tax=Nocardioides agariphilus TaxID=433664 RepID=A0A930VFM2_9ACTN|nr:hypothetical protein [Nocardioides agariphilus]MBF4766614.1 hypothetical protein [Nocardioides agariphilus]